MKRQKLLSLLLLLVMVVTVFSGNVAKAKFSDLAPTHWCYEKIMDFYEKEYICGYVDGTFRPDQTIIRAEYVKMVNNFFGYPLNEDFEISFTDISGDEWFVPYVKEAVARGYIKGFEDDTFRPDAPITRQEATVILSRILGIDDETYPEDHVDGMQKYSDGTNIDDWAYKAIHSYSVYGFISGYLDGTIRLKNNVTRAETVELLNRLEEQIEIDRKEYKHKVRRVQTPVITVYEQESGEDKVATSWVNDDYAYQNPGENMKHAMVEITCPTDGAEIHYTVKGGEEQIYDGRFPVYEGRSEIEAYATKPKMAKSSKALKIAKVDTVAPRVAGIKGEESVRILAEDYNQYDVNEISGLDKASLKLAWFTMEERIPYYPENQAIALKSVIIGEAVYYSPWVRESDWMELDENGEVPFPTEPGIYFLGAKAKDIAGNWMDEGLRDTRAIDGVEEPTDDPFVIVTENEVPEDDVPDTEPSGDQNPSGEELNPGDEDIVVNIPASYKVEHHKQNANDDEYTLAETETLEAPVDSYVTATIRNYDGFNFNASESEISDYVERDGSTVLVAKYDRNIHTVTYIIEEEIIGSGEYKYGQDVPEKEPITRIGYTFDGWSGEVSPMPDHDVEVTGSFTANDDTKYKVEHYLEPLISGDDFILKETDDMTGTTGEETKAEANEYDGFTAPTSIEQKVIEADGSTVVEIYYTRNSYWLTYMLDGRQHEDREEHKYEEPITPRVIKVEEGYHFSGWNPEVPEKMPADHLTVSGEILPDTDTKYRYEYLLEDLTDTALTYTVIESGERTGTTDEEVELEVKDFDGFTFDSGDSRNNLKDNIAGNGSTVLRAYYKRDRYDLTYKVDGDIQEPVENLKYGKPIIIRDEPTPPLGFTFSGWSETAETLPTMPAHPVVIEGYFEKDEKQTKTLRYTIEYYKDGEFEESGEVTKTIWVGSTETTLEVKPINENMYEDYELEKTIPEVLPEKIENGGLIKAYFVNSNQVEAIITANYPNGDIQAEPEDVVTYKITLEPLIDALRFPINIVIRVDSELEVQTSSLPTNASYNDHEITWTVNSIDDVLTYNAEVDKDTPAGSELETVIIDGAIGDDHILDVENTVKIKAGKDKNIVLVLDVSSSMNSKIGSGRNAKTKLQAMKDAANAFVKSILENKEDKDDITFTIVAFEGKVEVKSTLVNPNLNDVKKEIDGLKSGSGTNIKGAIKEAINVLESGKDMLDDASDVIVFLSDGEAYPSYNALDDDTLTDLRALGATTFSIGVGNSFNRNELLQIVNGDIKRLFTVSDADALMNAFKEIAEAVNAIQSTKGIVSTEAESEDAIYPIKLAYIDIDDNPVSVIISASEELEANNLTVEGTTVTWDISNYPGCSKFELELATEEVMMLSFMLMRAPVELPELAKTELPSGDTETEAINPVSGEEDEVPVIDEAEKVSGEATEEVPTESVKEPVDEIKEVSGDTIEEIIEETSEVLVEEIGEVEPAVEPEKQNEGEDEASTENKDENADNAENTDKEDTTDDVEAILPEEKKEDDEEEA